MMDLEFDERWLNEAPPEDFYSLVSIPTVDHHPLLAAPRLARRTVETLDACAPDAPGRLWGYVVLPESVRMVVGPTADDRLDTFITRFKAASSARLIEAIRRADDDALDAVLRYTPVWGGVVYQVWQAGYHRTRFWTEYRLSNALYDLRQAPVIAGLVAEADAWPYRAP